MVRSLRGEAEAAGVAIETAPSPAGETVVSCDVRHLSSAVKELVANAVAHAPRGTAVGIRFAKLPDGAAAIEIQDRGAGLSPEQIERCREPFAQGVDPMTRAVGGLGLGLPTAQRILELHGGRLELCSAPGEGACARLILPPAPERRRAVA